MREERDIIEEYKQNGFFERMHLFLQYRDLRDVFQALERQEPESQPVTIYLSEGPQKEKRPKGLTVLNPQPEMK
jgi:hypothetical protein